jgi:hypothetical protein
MMKRSLILALVLLAACAQTGGMNGRGHRGHRPSGGAAAATPGEPDRGAARAATARLLNTNWVRTIDSLNRPTMQFADGQMISGRNGCGNPWTGAWTTSPPDRLQIGVDTWIPCAADDYTDGVFRQALEATRFYRRTDNGPDGVTLTLLDQSRTQVAQFVLQH